MTQEAPMTPSPRETTVNYPCQNCGHSDRIHRKLDGCMTFFEAPTLDKGRRRCPCTSKPDEIRAVAAIHD